MTDRADGAGGAAPGVAPKGRTGATVWRRAPSTSYVDSAGRAVILDLGHLDRMPYVFAGPAAEIWGCVDGERTESEIAEDLAEAFDVSVDVVGRDVAQFLDQLQVLGLVVAD